MTTPIDIAALAKRLGAQLAQLVVATPVTQAVRGRVIDPANGHHYIASGDPLGWVLKPVCSALIKGEVTPTYSCPLAPNSYDKHGRCEAHRSQARRRKKRGTPEGPLHPVREEALYTATLPPLRVPPALRDAVMLTAARSGMDYSTWHRRRLEEWTRLSDKLRDGVVDDIQTLMKGALKSPPRH